MGTRTFIVDCTECKAKVAAEVKGVAEQTISGGQEDGPYGKRLYVGTCPRCGIPLVGESHQTHWEGQDWQGDVWSDVRRVYPKPTRTFSSWRIPKVLTDSLLEGDKSLQGDAPTAACVMFARALEALCRDILEPVSASPSPPGTVSVPQRKIMLGEGIKRLREGNHIDERLYDWSQKLNAFRNIAAHPDDALITRRDAEDFQVFVNAIVEFTYDLKDRYDEFIARQAQNK